MSKISPAEDLGFLIAPGALSQLIRQYDWSATPLGPIQNWHQSLRTSVSLMLNSQHPMWIGWGPDATFLYNDAYIQVLSMSKHPWALGRPAAEVWREIWDICGPLADKVFNKGEPTFVDDVRLFMSRGNYYEETYYSFSYSPIRDETGAVGGLFCPSAETTSKVLAARRLQTLSELAARALADKTVKDACTTAAAILAKNPDDVPFALLYLVDSGSRKAVLENTIGLPIRDPILAPEIIDLSADAFSTASPIHELLNSRANSKVVDVGMFTSLPMGLADQPIEHAIYMPIRAPGHDQTAGILIAGVSPARLLDDDYLKFFELVAAQVATTIQNAKTIAEEKQRADMLAEADRAKTIFFSNVSHEFRTPLTLMLGPVTDALADKAHALDGPQRDRIELIHRNTLRLQKLVNSLLDFSRIQAGRVQATYVKTDLASYTADLASAFRSAIEKSGITFEVDCPAMPEAAYIDRSMWEKIVFNLLSNAFKFTFSGRIRVRLGLNAAGQFELSISDTGVGIAAEHLPKVFERFHRVEGARSRTHEGSGIGLSLVNDLATLHGGKASVHSKVGQGTTFTVTIPPGFEHLPTDHVQQDANAPDTNPQLAEAYVLEVESWISSPQAHKPDTGIVTAQPGNRQAESESARILVADDNTDMRNYIVRLLQERWTVDAAGDGRAALELVKRQPPDLIVSDVMMPIMDGFEFLKELKSNKSTSHIPFIMLSARAGEEAKIQGLDAGADDYLVKPFSGRELVARVDSFLLRSRMRKLETAYAARMRTVFEQAPAAIAIFRGPEHVYELANKPYLDFINGRQVLGKTIRQALPELAGQGIFELLDGVYKTGNPYVGKAVRADLLRGTPPTLTECYFDFVYQPMFDSANRVEGITVVGFEVTNLVKARQSAEVANRAKDEFLAMLGHELRNPLAPILTAVQLMRLRGTSAVDKERSIIERQAKHMVRLIDDLLDVSRVTRGKIELRKERIEVAIPVAKAIEMARPLLEERAQYFDLHVPSEGLVVDADPVRLAQVIGNLLTNASKYTDKGGHISLKAEPDGQFVRIEVADSGIGISPEMQPFIFDLFIQSKQALDRSRGGLGLGLAIVKSITGLHGGTVEVHSEGTGAGSIFTVRIPALKGSRESSGALPNTHESLPIAPNGIRHSVLLVDDNLDAAQSLAEVLKLYGHEVEIAPDGPAGLKAAAACKFDFALLDIGLPGMDGYELATHLRKQCKEKTPKLIALSGYGLPDDRRRSVEAGFDLHLVKPVDIDRLNESLLAIGGRTSV